MPRIKLSFILFLIVLFNIVGCNPSKPKDSQSVRAGISRSDFVSDDEKIRQAYQNHQGGFFVGSAGTVEKILKDDVEGARHQRFIVRLASGQTLLLTHNIDIAPRIENLQVGDRVYFYGMYEWNDKGGVLHWTHHDPQGRKPGGWVGHKGKRYQ